jgi:hypothetical protein
MSTELTGVSRRRGNLELENDSNITFSSEGQMPITPFIFDQSVTLSPLLPGPAWNCGASDEEIPLQTLKIL